MCEILLQFTKPDIPNTDPRYSQRCLQGDVIAVCPDGWVWSDREQTNPNWRVLKIPGLSETNPQVQRLTQARVDPVSSALLRKREFVLDVAAIPSAIKTYLVNHQTITLTTAQAQTVVGWIKNHSVDLMAD